MGDAVGTQPDWARSGLRSPEGRWGTGRVGGSGGERHSKRGPGSAQPCQPGCCGAQGRGLTAPENTKKTSPPWAFLGHAPQQVQQTRHEEGVQAVRGERRVQTRGPRKQTVCPACGGQLRGAQGRCGGGPAPAADAPLLPSCPLTCLWASQLPGHRKRVRGKGRSPQE